MTWLEVNMEAAHESGVFGLHDVPMFIGVCVGMAIYRLVMCKLVIRWVGRRMKVAKLEKFVHRTFDLIHYTTSAVIGTIALKATPYSHCWFNAIDCGESFLPTAQCFMTTLEKLYYMIFTSYYVVDLFYLWTATDPRMLLLHHFATLSMITMSVVGHVQVIGLSVMLLHDIVDVPLYIGKVATYLGYQKTKDVSLLVMAVLYTVLRMGNYPCIIYHAWRNVFTHGISIRPKLYYVDASLLFVLMFCHCYWFSKIVKGAVKMFKEGSKAIVDNRSEENEENERKKKAKESKQE